MKIVCTLIRDIVTGQNAFNFYWSKQISNIVTGPTYFYQSWPENWCILLGLPIHILPHPTWNAVKCCVICRMFSVHLHLLLTFSDTCNSSLLLSKIAKWLKQKHQDFVLTYVYKVHFNDESLALSDNPCFQK